MSELTIGNTFWMFITTSPPIYKTIASLAIVIPSQTLYPQGQESVSLVIIETIYGQGFCMEQGNRQTVCSQTESEDSTSQTPQRLWFLSINGLLKYLDHSKNFFSDESLLSDDPHSHHDSYPGEAKDWCFLIDHQTWQTWAAILPILAKASRSGALRMSAGAITYSDTGLQRFHK